MAQGAISAGNPTETVHTRTTATGPQSMACVVGVDGSDSVVASNVTRGVRVDLSSNGRQSNGHVVIGTAVPPDPVAVSSFSIPCKSVSVTAYPTNTQRIVIGDANISPATSTLRGIPLEPGESVALELDDINKLYFHVLAAGGTGLTWTAVI